MIARGYVVVTNVNDGAKGDKGDKGDRGLPGAGVKSTVVEYARGLSPTDPPGKYLVDGSGNPLADESGNILVDSRWTSAIPQIPDGFYLWSRTTTIYDDDSESVTYSVGYKGASIATERRQYYLSTSNSSLVGGSWQYTEPDASDGTFIWERFEFILTDGTIRYSDAVYSKTLHGIINKTDELEQKIVQKVWETDIDAKISSYDGETVQTVRDRVNNTEIDLSGIWTAISDDETKTVTKADGTVVTTLASRVHDIKDTADEHTRTISQDILGDSTTSLKTVANQAANHFTWLVKSGTSSSNMTLTNDALRIIARDIDLTGKVTFNSFDTSTKKRITDVEDEVESINIGDIITTYGVSNGPTVQPTTWSSTVPTFQEGKYIWQKTVKTSRTGTDTTTIVCLTGHKGDTGNTGNGVKSTEIKYTASSSGTVIPCMPLVDVSGNPLSDGNGLPLSDGVWSSTVPSSKDGDYIWARTKIIYDDDSESITYTVARNGIGIDSTVPYYYLSASKPNHNPLTNSDWSATTPDYQLGKLYWKCEVVTYKDGTKKATDVVEDKGLNEAISRAYLAYNTSVNANTILTAWASDAITSTTKINGGYIKTHTINSEHLATNAIMSQNFLSYNNNTKPFSQTGTYLDLANGNFFSPTFAIINSAPSGSGMTTGAYFNGHINAQSLTLGGDVKIGGDAHTTTTPGIQISTAGLLKAYNAEISGNIKAKTGDIGGWSITTDKLWYGNQTHGAATEAFILTPKGENVNAAIGGASGSNKWAMSIGKAFGVTTNGYMYANSGKIGGWTIGNGTNGHNGIYNGTDTISSTTVGIYIGTDGIRNYNSATSYVSISSGKITAKDADISGKITATSGSFTGSIKASDGYIGSSDSDSSRIVLDGIKHAIYYNISDFSTSNTNPGFYIGSAGIVIGKGFYVDSSGNTNLKVTGTKASGGTTVQYSFNLDGDGYLSASNVNLDGYINAKSGKIGNWIIDGSGFLKNDENSPTIILSPASISNDEGGYQSNIYAKFGSVLIDENGGIAGGTFRTLIKAYDVKARKYAYHYFPFVKSGNSSDVGQSGGWEDDSVIVGISGNDGIYFAHNKIFIKQGSSSYDLVNYLENSGGTDYSFSSAFDVTTSGSGTYIDIDDDYFSNYITQDTLDDYAQRSELSAYMHRAYQSSSVKSGSFNVNNSKAYLAFFFLNNSDNSCGLYFFVGGRTFITAIKAASNVTLTLTSSKLTWSDSTNNVNVRIYEII